MGTSLIVASMYDLVGRRYKKFNNQNQESFAFRSRAIYRAVPFNPDVERDERDKSRDYEMRSHQ
jgi:hypothetical protein